jgi:histidinol-phosphate phosphatase family protein
MRIVMFGSFSPYQVPLANSLSKHAEVMLILIDNSIENEIRNLISSRVRVSILGKSKALLRPGKLGAWLPIIDKIKEFKPDIAHIQMGGGLIEYFGWQLLRRYPVISTFHDVNLHLGEEPEWMIPIIQFIRNSIRSNSDAVIVHAASLREMMIKEYGMPGDRVYAVPMGQTTLSGFCMPEDEKPVEIGRTILFFGRIFPYKGLEYLIRAEPIVSEKFPDVKIVIAGRGEDFEKYQKMIGDRSSKYEVYNRYLPSAEAAQLFRQCSIVVLPYVEASQSGVVMDAYAFKKPVIVTNVGGIPEVVDDEKTGLIVPPRDSKSLAEAMIRLLGDAQLRKDMGQRGYRKLMTDQHWDSVAEKTLQVYSEVLKKRSCRTSTPAARDSGTPRAGNEGETPKKTDFAVFIDRDGTIVFDKHYLAKEEDLEMIPTVPEGISKLNGAGIPVIVVTNQSGVARGYFDEAALERIHQHLRSMLEKRGAMVDDIYYCPHMPDAGCNCRKPAPGMLLDAKREHGFDLTKSYIIGDRMIDVEMAHIVGAKGILVPEPGDQYRVDNEISASGEKPDMRKVTFVEAVDWILDDIKKRGR